MTACDKHLPKLTAPCIPRNKIKEESRTAEHATKKNPRAGKTGGGDKATRSPNLKA